MKIKYTKEEYTLFLKSPEWVDFRKRAAEIFHNECWFCKTKNAILQLHHTRYVERNCNPEYLKKKITSKSVRWLLLVCRQCHQKIHEIQWEESISIYGATKTFGRRYKGITPYMSKKKFGRYFSTINTY